MTRRTQATNNRAREVGRDHCAGIVLHQRRATPSRWCQREVATAQQWSDNNSIMEVAPGETYLAEPASAGALLAEPDSA